MKKEEEFLMPDYYPLFRCKMGECRHACCVGWPISVSMENYFRLLGVECSKHLRDRLDVGLRMAENPAPDRYAQFNPRYDGNCPLRTEHGLCHIHAELGEEMLPDICRLYPRGIRLDKEPECSCANSCEAVIELLIRHAEPIAFLRRRMTVDAPEMKHTPLFDTLGRGQEIRLAFIRVLQGNRGDPLSARLEKLLGTVETVDAALKQKDSAELERILAARESGENLCHGKFLCGNGDAARGFRVMEGVIRLLDERHDSIRDFGGEVIAYYGDGENSFSRYKAARAHFEAIFPAWECWFENLLVNHIFFARFPFQERPVSLRDECVALFVEYALLRVMAIGWMAGREDEVSLVDVLAAVFRMIDHTEFEAYAAVMLKKLGVYGSGTLADLLVL